MPLAIFDLDNTLLKGDSDHAWGDFLVSQGVIDAGNYQKINDHYLALYHQGQLDINEYLQFSLKHLSEHPKAKLEAWRRQFIEQVIETMILPKAQALLAKHRQQQHHLLIITASNRFITEPIAQRLAVDDLIAIELEEQQARFTGKTRGVLSFREGKIARLKMWLTEHPQFDLNSSYFYSDSINDLPLLSYVDYPVAVDPDEKLAKFARKQAWPIISLRE